jgi:hypothetical protein
MNEIIEQRRLEAQAIAEAQATAAVDITAEEIETED